MRREIELAVSSRKTILPLLVGGATMPPPDAFPPEIAELTTRQALRVDEESWGSQVEAVLDRLASRIPERTPRSGAEPRQEPAVADEFRSIASRFYDAPVEDRLAAAEEIAGIAGLLELDDVLAFGASSAPSERVGAAIAIAAHLRMSEQPREEPRVQSTLRALLNDDRSRVRYRAAEVLRGFPALVPAYRGDLAWRADNDENEYVRRMARNALRRGADG